MPFGATWIELEIIMLSDIIPRKRKRGIIYYQLYVKSKTWHKWTYLQNRNGLTDIEDKLMVTKGKKWSRRGKLGVWDFQIQTTIYKIDKQQGPIL